MDLGSSDELASIERRHGISAANCADRRRSMPGLHSLSRCRSPMLPASGCIGTRSSRHLEPTSRPLLRTLSSSSSSCRLLSGITPHPTISSKCKQSRANSTWRTSLAQPRPRTRWRRARHRHLRTTWHVNSKSNEISSIHCRLSHKSSRSISTKVEYALPSASWNSEPAAA